MVDCSDYARALGSLPSLIDVDDPDFTDVEAVRSYVLTQHELLLHLHSVTRVLSNDVRRLRAQCTDLQAQLKAAFEHRTSSAT